MIAFLHFKFINNFIPLLAYQLFFKFFIFRNRGIDK